jgi:hypothetical protein
MPEHTAPIPSAAPTAEEIVASPANPGDLEKEMKAVSRPFSKVNIWLGVLAVVALAFAGGAWTHSALAGTTSNITARPAAAGAQGQTGQRGQGLTGTGRQGATGRGTVGTVARVDGTTVYVKTAEGTEVAVTTGAGTTVSVAQPGKVGDLQPGANVVVQGATGDDGKVAAQSITQSPAGAGG